jgi:hypothetical protein
LTTVGGKSYDDGDKACSPPKHLSGDASGESARGS